MLKQRILTAIILVLLVLAGIYFLPPFYFALALCLILAVAAWEWARVSGCEGKWSPLFYAITYVLASAAIYFLPLAPLLMIGFVCWLWAGVAVYRFARGKSPVGLDHKSLRLIFGILVLVPTWTAFILLQADEALGPLWVLYILLVVWATDTGAYFCGNKWGKQLLAERVSPNKTREGLYGGLLSAFIVAVLASLFLPISGMQFLYIYMLAMVAAAFSILGDLFESLLKRQSGVKDSGTILPGHGGLLDRIDSTLPAVTVFALGILMLGLY